MTTETKTPAARNDYILGEIVDVRRLLDATNKIIEDPLVTRLEKRLPRLETFVGRLRAAPSLSRKGA